MYNDTINTKFGFFEIVASELGITHLKLCVPTDKKIHPNENTEMCKSQLLEYFDGNRKQFDLSLDLSNGTPFFAKVWKEVALVPYGTTKSYMDIANALDNVGAIRAVGMANGKNPVPIIIPCHRIIGSDGSLTGYAYGLDMKKKLLMLENPNTFGMQQKLF